MLLLPKLEEIKPETALARFTSALNGGGALLLAGRENSRPNPMTIGWAALGTAWGEPTLLVYVRPARYTYELMQGAGRFSVNVPAPGELSAALSLCGSKSGRDMDKLAAAGLKAVPGRAEGVFVLENCGLYFECETMAVSRIRREDVAVGTDKKFYPAGDYHAVFHGRILNCYGRAA
ncbi:MAG: flavin reductase family protein [Elusimicrobia bacterium]|nr:flavin reductase family protein [Elusimicrobiota bacterium]